VTKAMSVVDASPLNDWTSVKVQFAGTHGRENPTYGFIYPHSLPADFGVALAAAHPERRHHHATHVAGSAKHHKERHEMAAAHRGADGTPHRLADRASTHRQHQAAVTRLAAVY